MGVNEDAKATKEAFAAQIDGETLRQVGAGQEAIAAAHPAGSALARGDAAPDFSLPEVRGGSATLSAYRARGPVVLSFYRGGWCPFCSLELQAWSAHYESLKARGGELIAISPEAPDHAAVRETTREAPFAVVTDADQSVAAAYGLVFELPADAAAAQRRLEAPLDRLNADGTWRLPVPATYVVDTEGVIVWAHAADDYTERAEPADVIAAVSAHAST